MFPRGCRSTTGRPRTAGVQPIRRTAVAALPFPEVETYELPPLRTQQVIAFWNKVDRSGEHWLWLGRTSGSVSAMPAFWIDGNWHSARRVAWRLAPGRRRQPHEAKPYVRVTCGERMCINPAHLELSQRGGHPQQVECRRGHELTPENVYVTTRGKRTCRICLRAGLAKRRKRYLKEGRGWGRTYKPIASPIVDKSLDKVPRKLKRGG